MFMKSNLVHRPSRSLAVLGREGLGTRLHEKNIHHLQLFQPIWLTQC